MTWVWFIVFVAASLLRLAWALRPDASRWVAG